MRIQYESELYHHGIKGQKWGVRKYQNADGSYTAAGRKRYARETAKEYNKIAKQNAKDHYRRQKHEKAYIDSYLASNSKLMQKVKPLGKLNERLGESNKKAYLALAEKTSQQRKQMDEVIRRMQAEGYDYSTKKAKTIVDGSAIVTPAFVYVNIVKRAYGKIKFTDPTQPKNRAERREEKDRNRLKNAAYEMDQAKADWKAKNAKAEATVGTTKEKTKYGTMERWNDPEHQHVKDVRAAQGRSFDADKRFAKEFDAYKKKHPNTDMDLSDWEKKRKKMYY